MDSEKAQEGSGRMPKFAFFGLFLTTTLQGWLLKHMFRNENVGTLMNCTNLTFSGSRHVINPKLPLVPFLDLVPPCVADAVFGLFAI